MAESQLSGYRGREKKWRISGAPVFGYHGISSGPEAERPARERKYWVRETEFRNQLDRIKERGFSAGRLEDLTAVPSKAHQMVHSVILTFDDGLISQYALSFPLLAEFKIKAYFFVNTSTIGKAGFLNWKQMLEMQGAGMSFQSHSHEHVYLPWLAQAALDRQLKSSKQMLEDRLGRAASFLSVPFGHLSGRVVETARRLGYQGVCSSRNWPARPGAYVVNRVAVYGDTPIENYQRLMEGDAPVYAIRAAREAAVYLPKKLLLRLRPSPAPGGELSVVAGK